ncbi:YgfZ/GcvT domain-containing protein [Stenoxybacter acetivorans]|uniref:CAF17-like 4Fe-4S cluster assembly/insertion protein YgfZ n=1 Tax=Stenoxybacter acetivorans TaxID=422441 RepID=UPI00056BCD7A|nr:folate-binding protein YgfZ [Stenoxybacter acetivorans]
MNAFSGSLLPFFGTVCVSGEDRHVFLHNQLSNDINHLAENQACYATYNTPKGRVLANMVVLNRGDDLLLIMAKDLIEAMIKRLKMYVLRSKVVLTADSDTAVAGEWVGNKIADLPDTPALVLPVEYRHAVWRIALPHGGTMLAGAAADLPDFDESAEKAWQLHELQCGYAWISAATTETCVAQMLNQHLIGGVHFRKGCYPGQEIIARAQYRGQVKRGLVLLNASSALAAGETVWNGGGEEVGLLINCVNVGGDNQALAVIKFTAAAQGLHTKSGINLQIQHLFFHKEAAGEA